MHNKFRFYVDGFNFYKNIAHQRYGYGIKWIDLRKLFRKLLEDRLEYLGITNPEIEKIYYFTAEENNDQRQERQRTYFNALTQKCRPGTSFITQYGRFKVSENKIGLQQIQKITDQEGTIHLLNTGHVQAVKLKVEYTDTNGNTQYKHVQEMEYNQHKEKETDVNLVCQMLKDIYTEYDRETRSYIPVLVSNDSDFSKALKIVREKTHGNAFLIIPVTTENIVGGSKELKEIISNVRSEYVIDCIKKETVEQCPLPRKVGNHIRPLQWSR